MFIVFVVFMFVWRCFVMLIKFVIFCSMNIVRSYALYVFSALLLLLLDLFVYVFIFIVFIFLGYFSCLFSFFFVILCFVCFVFNFVSRFARRRLISSFFFAILIVCCVLVLVVFVVFCLFSFMCVCNFFIMVLYLFWFCLYLLYWIVSAYAFSVFIFVSFVARVCFNWNYVLCYVGVFFMYVFVFFSVCVVLLFLFCCNCVSVWLYSVNWFCVLIFSVCVKYVIVLL